MWLPVLKFLFLFLSFFVSPLSLLFLISPSYLCCIILYSSSNYSFLLLQLFFCNFHLPSALVPDHLSTRLLFTRVSLAQTAASASRFVVSESLTRLVLLPLRFLFVVTGFWFAISAIELHLALFSTVLSFVPSFVFFYFLLLRLNFYLLSLEFHVFLSSFPFNFPLPSLHYYQLQHCFHN